MYRVFENEPSPPSVTELVNWLIENRGAVVLDRFSLNAALIIGRACYAEKFEGRWLFYDSVEANPVRMVIGSIWYSLATEYGNGPVEEIYQPIEALPPFKLGEEQEQRAEFLGCFILPMIEEIGGAELENLLVSIYSPWWPIVLKPEFRGIEQVTPGALAAWKPLSTVL